MVKDSEDYSMPEGRLNLSEQELTPQEVAPSFNGNGYVRETAMPAMEFRENEYTAEGDIPSYEPQRKQGILDPEDYLVPFSTY
jgi:hypothetical protein